ncbi:hypothetical protein [Mesorhizobium comanense]|uniref:hypothetical protein n=1 Tax=Mesorhizobium comanense TaxID=2502215 RepID=UPI0010F47683|nr:hypothetical protein [Mesorhizobium comanense]
MRSTELVRVPETSPGRDVKSGIGSYISGRHGLIAAGVAIAVAGLAFNWSWLVAAGIAPVLLSLLPCAAMCTLGLCMNRMRGSSCSTENAAPKEGANNPKVHSADMEGHG